MTLKTWERKFYSVPGGEPSLFYVLYETFDAGMPPMSQATYHSKGIPAGFDLMQYDRSEYNSVLDGFCSGFGRPDLGMFNVTPDLKDGAIEMVNRFIEFQAFGGILEEGKEISMQGLPEGLFCHHAGDLDDPDFNNVHVEIRIT